MRKGLVLLAIAAATLCIGSLSAQVTTASMSGKVSDQAGEPLAGATVVAVHTTSGTQTQTMTDAKGLYRLSNMRPGGPYAVTFSYIGYNDHAVNNLYLNLAENNITDVKLMESSVSLESVVVTAPQFSNMNSSNAGATTNIGTRQINAMPTISRNFTDLTRITPQANGAAIGGGTYRQSNITIDGASFNNKFGIGQSMPANGSPISLDAIEQISVSVTPYDVRQSGFLGAAINAVTRSGDNEFRGSVYTYLNNEKFKGNKVGDQTFERTPSSYNLYGVRIGGPVIKNKLFFFLNFEMENSEVPGPSRVAATAENPYTDGTNNVARPTASDMDRLSQFLNSTYGYKTGSYQGYSNESPGMKILARVDWNINKNHRLNVRYNMTTKKDPYLPSTSISGIQPSPYASSYNRTGMYAMWYQNTGYYQEQNFSSIAGELNSTFGRIANLLRVTYTDQDEPRSVAGNIDFPFVDILKDGLPYISFGTELFSYGNLRKVQTYTIGDDVSFDIGNHAFTAGLQFEHNLTKNGFQRFGTGYYQFASLDDFINGQPAGVFALTHPNNEGLTQEFPSFKFNQFTAYLQDEISISDRWKILAGLRVDLPFYPKLNTYNAAVEALGYGENSDIHYNTTELPKTSVMFSPRLGVNYDVLGNRKVVIRGGTGIFTGTIPFVWIVSQAGDAGVLQTTTTGYGTAEKPIPGFYSSLNDIVNAAYGGSFNPATPALPSQITILDKNLKLPQQWKSSLAVDVKLPWGIIGTLEEIYSRDINSVIVENAGLKPDGFKIADYADQRTISLKQYWQNGLKNVYMLKNGGKQEYWSLTAKLEKPIDKGFSAMVAYTYSWGRGTSDGIGDQINSAWYNNPRIYGSNVQEMGYLGYVLPHRVIASASYRIDYAKHFASTFSIFYKGASQGRFSYVNTNGSGGLVNDGSGTSLIYIPKDDSEIEFVDLVRDGNVVYTAAQQRELFWAYIDQDDYLSKHKGEYAERNGALYPFIHSFDFKFLQDFYMNIAGKRNTLQVGVDIMNLGNLLNSKWGTQYYYNRNNFLQVANLNAVVSGQGSVKPQYQFLQNGTADLKETFRPNIGYDSTYYLQLSVRYIFN
ncbi:MAG: carboxypeptidase regulatory-like domain-containing protein [Prevotellaceae bacterium]|jgi:hypothetical protein|nr:carboxypeptidase regulatory-like domain-containing protein [Prevotellaceae bacterium]